MWVRCEIRTNGGLYFGLIFLSWLFQVVVVVVVVVVTPMSRNLRVVKEAFRVN